MYDIISFIGNKDPKVKRLWYSKVEVGYVSESLVLKCIFSGRWGPV